MPLSRRTPRADLAAGPGAPSSPFLSCLIGDPETTDGPCASPVARTAHASAEVLQIVAGRPGYRRFTLSGGAEEPRPYLLASSGTAFMTTPSESSPRPVPAVRALVDPVPGELASSGTTPRCMDEGPMLIAEDRDDVAVLRIAHGRVSAGVAWWRTWRRRLPGLPVGGHGRDRRRFLHGRSRCSCAKGLWSPRRPTDPERRRAAAPPGARRELGRCAHTRRRTRRRPVVPRCRWLAAPSAGARRRRRARGRRCGGRVCR